MKPILLVALLVCGLVPGPMLRECCGAQTNESALIEILRSHTSSPLEKDLACAQLKRTGTARSVPALATLLSDPQLSQSARYALESMPNRAAGRALLQALPRVSGLLQAGIINSRAARGDSAAISKLGKLLANTDVKVAVAAAEALGRIGGSKSLRLLQTAAATSTNSLHAAAMDGILICANRLLDAGRRADALKIFNGLYSAGNSDAIRVAAFRGMLLSSGKQSASLMAGAIAGSDGPARIAALRVASEVDSAEVTGALAELTAKVEPAIQVALIKCLARRNDPVALPAITKLTDSPDPGVRVAAITALGSLGDDSVIELLADRAVTSDSAERSAARQVLVELNRGPVTQHLLALLRITSPAVQAQLLKAIGERGDNSAVPALFEFVQRGSETQTAAAFQALAQLANAGQLTELLQLIVNARSDEMRSAAADAFNSVSDRGRLDVAAFAHAVNSADAEARLALLPICSGLAQEPVRAALRAALSNADPRVRQAATRALCETIDAELLPDLLQLACQTNQDVSRLAAIRGCVRLATQEESVKLPAEKQLAVFTQIIVTPLDTAAKQAVLAGLGAVADPQALALAMQMRDDTSVEAEAEQAVLRVAVAISAAHPAEAGAALKKILAVTTNAATRKSAETALAKIH